MADKADTTGEATEPKTPVKGGQHRATFARDKRQGGYLIRVEGPYANRFAGRAVPVHLLSGEVKEETLIGVKWSGKDDDGNNVALYDFVRAERVEFDDEIPF